MEAGRGKDAGGAAAIAGCCRVVGVVVYLLLGAFVTKKTNPGRGFGIVFWTVLSSY